MSNQHTERPEYTECFVAYIDLLRFGSLVKESKNEPETIATLVAALNRIAGDTPKSTHIKARRDEERRLAGWDTWVLQVRPFSDCVCLFIPTAGGQLSWLLHSIRYIHDRMLELSVCIRGAITIGGMYWDRSWGSDLPELQRQLRDEQFRAFGKQPPHQEPNEDADSNVLYQAGTTGFPITLGPAFVEAYELERNVAVYPRVIASNELVDWLDKHGSDGAFPLTAPSPGERDIPINSLFRTCCDGRHFFDVLHPAIARNDTERIVRTHEANGRSTIRWERASHTHADVMADLDRLVEAALSRAYCPEKIRAKYEWLKYYWLATAKNDGPHEDA